MEHTAATNRTIPLGGIGAGFLLLDDTGRFSGHIPATSIQGTPLFNSKICLRLHPESEKPYIRALHGEISEQNMPGGTNALTCLTPSQYQSYFHYPNASFQLCDPESPAAVNWTCFSPVIPYDPIAATMPVVMVRIYVHNTLTEFCEATVMFMCDNIAEPVSRGNASGALVYAVDVPCTADEESSFSRKESQYKRTGTSPTAFLEYGCNGLIFGEQHGNYGGSAHPHACLAARTCDPAEITVSWCNPDDPAERQQFWETFLNEGKPACVRSASTAPMGAVSISLPLPPRALHCFDFVFAWHVPETCDETGRFGNAYLRFFKTAQDTVQYALQNFDYMLTAVEKWQQRLLSPRQPADFGIAVLESAGAFTTHARHARKGGLFFLPDSHYPHNETPLHWEFLPATALLSFAPHYHTLSVTRELKGIVDTIKKDHFVETPAFLRNLAMLILSSYADILYLSHRARMAEWMPLMQAIFERVIMTEKNSLASEETVVTRFSLEGTGLWAPALDAMARMARETGAAEDGAQFQRMSALFYAHYQSNLYTYCPAGSTQECASTGADGEPLVDIDVLAGPCFSRMLGLEPPAVVGDMVTSLAAEPGIASGTDACVSVRTCAVGVLARLLYKGKGGGSAPEIRALFKSMYNQTVIRPHKTPAPAALPGPDTLACWAVLQAAAGFSYDALRQTVTLRLPQDLVYILKFPILCPLSLGIVIVKRFKEEEGLILFRFCVETPLSIKSILLHLPKPAALETITCLRNGETLTVRHESAIENNNTFINMALKPVQKMVNTFTLRLRELPDNGEEKRL